MSATDDAPRGSVQQLFLQAVLAAPVMDEPQIDTMVASLNRGRAEGERRALEPLLAAANTALDAIDMELVKARNDFDRGRFVYVLVARAPLPPGADRRFLSAPQAAQLKDILGIMFADSRCEGVLPARDLPAADFPSRGEIVERLVQGRWLEPLSGGRVFLGTRGLYELQSYLTERFGGRTLHRCVGCEQWFLAGRLCSNFTCTARLHDRCYDAYFQSRSEPLGVCPTCGSPI